MAGSAKYLLLVAIAILVLLPAKADAFGAGNIASISKIEGKNWRHGDIEDMLATVACIKGHKWKSMMIKVRSLAGDWRVRTVADARQRVYFGNWLRDYSQVRCFNQTQSNDAELRRLSTLRLLARFK